jgi:hypothetical protein
MDDSSLNPYIPGSSDRLQGKVKRPQTLFARICKIALIVFGSIVVVIGIALIFILQNTSKVDEKARADFATTLQPTQMLTKHVTIKSGYGFTLSYPEQSFNSHGEVGLSRIAARGVDDEAASTESYENNDLKKVRAYGLIRLTPIESSERARAATALPPELEIHRYDKQLLLDSEEQKAAESESEKDNTTSDKSATKGKLAVSTFIAIDNKKRVSDRTSDDGTVVTIDATRPTRVEIAGVEYQKVRYTTHNENYQISTEKHDDCYYTIQNDEPYSVCVINVRPNKVSVGALLEDTVRLVSFENPEVKPKTATDTAAKPATTAKPAAIDEDAIVPEARDAEQLVVIPSYIKDWTALKALAKNQPSVMRLGTLYCANIALKQSDGITGTTLTDACSGKVASGVFISNNGYVAAAGHTVRTHPKEAINGYINLADSQKEMQDRLQRILDYLLKAKLILQSSADYLKSGAATGNQDALAKIENIGSIIPADYVQASNESYNYALQLTDKPIVLNTALGNKPSFAYSDTVVAADFVKSDYDVTKYSKEQFDSSHSANDIALLKIKANALFPVATIGQGDNLGANQKLVTLGFPAFTDSNLTGDKLTQMAVATTSSVNQTFSLEGQKIIDVNTPIPPGNDGAPVFNDRALLVGFAAYGPSYCPDQQCFGSGTVRSTNPLSALIDKNNIELDNTSKMSVVWAEGVEAYFVGNYEVAASKFAEAGKMYGSNQWASELADLAKSKFAAPSNTSFMNQLATMGITTAAVLAILMVIIGISLFIHIKRLDMLQVGHAGIDQPTVGFQSTTVSQPLGTPQTPSTSPWGAPQTPATPPQQPAPGQWSQQQPQQQAQPQSSDQWQAQSPASSSSSNPWQPQQQSQRPQMSSQQDSEPIPIEQSPSSSPQPTRAEDSGELDLHHDDSFYKQ